MAYSILSAVLVINYAELVINFYLSGFACREDIGSLSGHVDMRASAQ